MEKQDIKKIQKLVQDYEYLIVDLLLFTEFKDINLFYELSERNRELNLESVKIFNKINGSEKTE